jgi:hypothetical protein
MRISSRQKMRRKFSDWNLENIKSIDLKFLEIFSTGIKKLRDLNENGKQHTSNDSKTIPRRIINLTNRSSIGSHLCFQIVPGFCLLVSQSSVVGQFRGQWQKLAEFWSRIRFEKPGNDDKINRKYVSEVDFSTGKSL